MIRFNLQYFAEGDVVHGVSQYINVGTPASSENYGTGGMSPEIKEFWVKKLLKDMAPELRFFNYAQKTSIPGGNGKTAEWRKFSSLGKKTDALSDGIPGTAQKLSVTTKTASVDWYGGYVEYTERLNLIAIDPLMSQYSEKLSEQAALTKDCLIRDVVNAGTNVVYASTYASSTYTAVTSRFGLDNTALARPKDIFKIAAKLKNKNAKTVDGSYIAIIHPLVTNDLMMNMTDGFNWVDVTKYSDKVKIENGEIGKLGNIRFVESTNQSIYYAPNLAGTVRTLKVKTKPDSAGATIAIKGATLTADALIGRYVQIGDNRYYVTDNGTDSLTLADPDVHTTAASIQPNVDTVIYPAEAGKNGCAVSAVTVIAADAYGTVDIAGNSGTEFIAKPLGWNDALNMRGALGWKFAIGTIRLNEDYIVRYEVGLSDDMGAFVSASN